MPRRTNAMSKIIFVLVSLLWMGACKNKVVDVPFPNEGQSFSSSVRLARYSEPKKLNWTVKSTGVKALIKKFEFDKLPVAVYDSTGFLKFATAPIHRPFDLDSLPGRPFNIYSLHPKPFRLNTQILEQPKQFKTAPPHVVNSARGLMYEFGDPLMGTHVTCILKDRAGLLWIASEHGLYRYDGEILSRIFSASVAPSVFSLMEDSKGRIWVGTQGNGILILDIRAGIFRQFSVAEGLSSDAIGRMVTDEKGRLWVTEVSRAALNGVDIIDFDSLIIRHITKEEGLYSNRVSGIARDSSNNIWIGNLDCGVEIIDLKNNTIKTLGSSNGINTNSISALLVDKEKRIWMGGFGDAEINMVDLQHRSITQYLKDTALRGVMIWDMTQDNKGNIWIETVGFSVRGKGVFVVDPEKERIRNISISGGLSSYNVEWITEDKLGQIWIATLTGLNMFNKGGRDIEHIGKSEITSMLEDSTGLFWICTAAKGVELLDRATGLIRIFDFKHGLSKDSLSSITGNNGEIIISGFGGVDIVNSVRKTIRHYDKKQGLSFEIATTSFRDDSDRIWIAGASLANGLDLLDEKKGTVDHIEFDSDPKTNGIYDIKQDQKGQVWIVTARGDSYIIDPVSKSMRHLLNAKENSKENDIIVTSLELLLDAKGNMWIGGSEGIYILDVAQDSLRRISYPAGLPSNDVRSLNEYAGQIFAATTNGLCIITPLSGSLQNFRIESYGNTYGIRKLGNTFASDNITKYGDFLWGDIGVTVLNNLKKEKTVPAVYISGIDIFNQPQNFINKNSSDLKESDTIWSSKKDSFYFKSKMSSDILYSIPKLAKWDSVTEPYNLPVNLQLPYDNNYLQFHFVQANLGSQDTIEYTYILEGADKKWSEITNNTFSQNYLNLPPGDYIFKVSARVKNGEWAIPATFNFSIMPPWWKTWWAYTLFVLLFVGATAGIINYRSKQLLRENSMLEERVAQRTHELKVEKEKAEITLAELKSTQSQLIQSEKMASLGELTAGIAHEIQNPLNFVNNFSDVNTELIDEITEAIDAGNFTEAKELMSNIRDNEVKIKYHGHRAEAIVKSMLQHSRISSGQMEPTDINSLADEYLRLSYHGLRAKDKSFNANMQTDFDPSVGKININQQEIGRVLLNLYNNAFYVVNEKKKHHPAGYEPTVSVSTKKVGDKAVICIGDNGDGIPKKVLDKIFQPFFTTKPAGQGTGLGLSMSYDIVKSHKGELKVNNREGEGAEFVILLPLV